MLYKVNSNALAFDLGMIKEVIEILERSKKNDHAVEKLKYVHGSLYEFYEEVKEEELREKFLEEVREANDYTDLE